MEDEGDSGIGLILGGRGGGGGEEEGPGVVLNSTLNPPTPGEGGGEDLIDPQMEYIGYVLNMLLIWLSHTLITDRHVKRVCSRRLLRCLLRCFRSEDTREREWAKSLLHRICKCEL